MEWNTASGIEFSPLHTYHMNAAFVLDELIAEAILPCSILLQKEPVAADFNR